MLRNSLRLAVCAFAIGLAGMSVAQSSEITVVDGDSLVIDGRQVEVWGIIAPAKSETCTTSQNEKWPCGERAFEQLAELAADETFACSDKEDGFVLCTAGGLDVGRLMVKEGLVRARQDYHDAEARARDSRIGLWE